MNDPSSVCSADSRVTYTWDETLQESWINDARGIEHGYTVLERPETEICGPLSITLSIRGDLLPRVLDGGRLIRFSSQPGAAVLDYMGLTVFDAKGRELEARFVEAAPASIRVEIEESDAAYPITVDPVAQQAYLKASNTDFSDSFGSAVAISGDTVVVGAPGESSQAIGVNGNQADNSASYAGAAYVFVRNGSSWMQQAYLKASNTNAVDLFGASVAVSGDILVVGAPFESSAAVGINGNELDNSANQAGAAYVFVRTGTVWVQEAYLKASNANADDQFGWSVTVDGNTIVVGAPKEDSSSTVVNGNELDENAPQAGAAYVFVRNGTSWSQQAYLKASNATQGFEFGNAVALSGDIAVVGSHHEFGDSTGVNGNQSLQNTPLAGAAYAFARMGASWTQQAYFKASNTEAYDAFGSSVAVEGDTVSVGAPYEDSAASGVNGNQADNTAADSGAVYTFHWNGSTWSQQAYLKASNTGVSDHFGNAVSISGNLLVAGASFEESSATGVNGDQSSNLSSSSGAAYVFVRTVSVWSQIGYLKAFNTGAGDSFGQAASLSGATALIGAPNEDSNATGVNGNGLNNTGFDSGAAYVFTLDPVPASFCLGDGTQSPCPCGNPGAAGRGCGSSAFSGGALLAASGNPGASVGTDSLVLTATDIPGPGLFFQSIGVAAAPIPFGDGLLCASVGIVRLGVVFPAAGSASYPGGLTPNPIHVAGAPLTAGSTRHYQCWYRSQPGLCSANNFDLTQGLTITWWP